MSMVNRTPDFEADIELLPTEDGGRRRPALSGYRPHLCLRDDDLTSGQQEYVGLDRVEPGGRAKAGVTLIAPERYAGALAVGMRLPFFEGRRVVGYATVTEGVRPSV